MNLVHVVRFGTGRDRRYLARADGPGAREDGWRPFMWTPDLTRAEKFSTAARARAYALEHLGHGRFDIGLAPPCGRPTDDHGGTPAAIRRAA